MSVKIDSSGFDKKMSRLSKQAKKMNDQPIPITTLMSSTFMKKYTSYSDIQDFFDANPLNEYEHFEDVPPNILDSHVKNTTNFQSWQEMMEKAGQEYLVSQLKF